MGTVQSMILGESDKVKPVVTSPVEKDASSSVAPVAAPDELAPDEYTGKVNEQRKSDSIATQQPARQYGNSSDILNAIYKDQMPTEEELKKERKREKARSIISAIADGASAISNLYFTGKGAKNVEQTSMSEANAKRYQEILDRRRKSKEKWDDVRLAAYDRDRVFNYQKDREDANWRRTGEWHDSQVRTDNERYKDAKERNDRNDARDKEERDRNYGLRVKAQENQEKAQKDASARGWAAVNSQDRRIKAQEEKQKAYVKYQFEKTNGSPEPKRISDTRSIYVGRNTWEQNAGQLAGEIIKDIESVDPSLAKQLSRQLNGYGGKKGADAKQTAALVDKYIMRSPRAQQLAIELENDYKKRHELAIGGALPQDDADDLGFVPSSAEKGSVDVDSLFD